MKIANQIIIVIIGFILGVIFSIYLFAIDVDILSVPYVNKGVKLSQDVEIIQNEIKLKIPNGTQMLLKRRLPSSNEYCILLNAYWDDENIIEFIGAQPEYFEMKKSTEKKQSAEQRSNLDIE